MTKPAFGGDRDKLGSYLRWMADQVGLRDWYINLSHGDPPGDPDFGGQCVVHPKQKRATIWIRGDWVEWDQDELRHTIIHELLHCHMNGAQASLEPLTDIMGNLGASIVISNHHHALEIAIDSMAYEWARQMPLPSTWVQEHEQE